MSNELVIRSEARANIAEISRWYEKVIEQNRDKPRAAVEYRRLPANRNNA